MNKKIAICGIQKQLIDIADFLIKNSIKISYIITINKEEAIKNKCESTWVDYEEFSKKNNIPIFYCSSYSLKNESDIKFFIEEKIDLIVLAGWQRLIPEKIINIIKIGIVGQHGSSEYLPKGRGRSPINWSIIQNKKRIIWNIFLIKPGVDDGNIIDSQMFDINEFDDCNTIYYKVSISVKNMLINNIPKLLNNTACLKLQKGQPTYFPKRTPEDGKIDWNRTTNEIYNLVRAVAKPYPGAFTNFESKKIMIWKCQPFDKVLTSIYTNYEYGQIVELFDNNNFLVYCCDGLLLVTEHDDSSVYINKKYV